jgi:thiol-disulfide isomerase/thioredoxin
LVVSWKVVRWIASGLFFSLLAGTGAGAAEPELISQGRRVDIEAHLVPGKLVLFDFFADWCAPCRIIKPHIKDLAVQYPENLAVREIDVINWDSPVAKQYGISVLPHLKLYGPDGSLLAEGDTQRVMVELERRLGGGAVAPPRIVRRSSSPVMWVVLIGVAVVGVVTFRRLTARDRPAPPPAGAEYSEPSSDPEFREIWFVVIGESLDGPFSLVQLADLLSKKLIDGSARLRRRGDATWRTVADVLDENN